MRTVHALIIASAGLAAGTQAQDTAFTYQGLLNENGGKAQGSYQVRFTLHDTGSGGSVVAGPITNTAVAVVNGLFSTTLDFGGAVFDGNRRWLEIGVATNGADSFTTLDPRQEILATPYAISAARLTAPLPSNGLAGTYAQPVSLSNPANTFAGDGGGLTNVRAATLGGLSRADLWQLGGNSGSAPNSFLGTTDEQPLELRVNNLVGLRLQPTSRYGTSVSVLAGLGASGGGQEGVGITIGGGISNGIGLGPGFSPVRASTISGGQFNTLRGDAATIGGGEYNSINRGGGCTISGGRKNAMGVSGQGLYTGDGVIGGGSDNKITGFGGACTIGGGNDNVIGSGSGLTIVGGTIGGGEGNRILGYQVLSPTIAGGANNKIDLRGGASVIGGGSWNVVAVMNPPEARETGSATIGGGDNNLTTAAYAIIPGGAQAVARNYGQMAHASGQFAEAGDAQTSVYVCRGTTTNAAPAELFLDGASQRMAMPTNSTWTFDILVTGRTPDGTSAAYQLLGATRNINGITTMAALRRQTILVEDIPTWDATLIAHATNSTFGVQVTGEAATSIRWVATVRTAEVTY